MLSVPREAIMTGLRDKQQVYVPSTKLVSDERGGVTVCATATSLQGIAYPLVVAQW